MFTAPISNYSKTLWYNRYDISDLLSEGENVISVICGNGWYNEDIKTEWSFNEAEWRDLPKFILALHIDDEIFIKSDDTWKCLPESAVYYNNIRNGEYFDANEYDPRWTELKYDDSTWGFAVIDDNPPTGIFAECKCEPIREQKLYPAKKHFVLDANKIVFDIGQNISGYVRVKTKCEKGQVLTFRYSEAIDRNGNLNWNDMDKFTFEGEFMTDKLVCSGQKIEWSPRFAYHGFRYIEVSGIKEAEEIQIFGVEVHQNIKRRTEFRCSDPFLNALFEAGVHSSYSNMFYALTDCPTREKLGWTNDAQASAEQMLTNFEAERLFEKWLHDIHDSMREDGSIPCIIPTAGWGYHWGNGPVSDGILFELPYRIYIHTRNKKPLIDSIPYFERYIEYLDNRKNADGLIEFGLDDWANPGERHIIPSAFINTFYELKFFRIIAIAYMLGGMKDKALLYEEKAKKQIRFIMDKYLLPSGECVYNMQTAVAMMIYYDVFVDIEPLKKQIKRLVEDNNYHHDCGMVGMRVLFHALDKCGLQEYSYRIITSKGYPSYSDWFAKEATTLWEYWDHKEGNKESRNHHMYSDVMSWMIKNIGGIRINEKNSCELSFEISPFFFKNLSYAECTYNTANGTIHIKWERNLKTIKLYIKADDGVNAYYNRKRLEKPENYFEL